MLALLPTFAYRDGSPNLVVVLVALLTALVPGPVLAAPRAGPLDAEDARVDGDLDREDLALRSERSLPHRHVLRSAPGGEAYVSLVGFARESPTGRTDLGGMIVLGLPLDRFARVGARSGLSEGTTKAGPTPPRPPPPGSSSHPPPAPPPPSAEPAPKADSERSDGSGPARPSEPDASERAPPVVLTAALARACVATAWRVAGLGHDDSRLDAIVSRAHWSALLPEARLRAIRFDDERLSTDATFETSRLRDAAGVSVGLEARLTWRLDHLLYAEDEPSFERMRLERHDSRHRLASQVLDALFHWQRARLELRYALRGTRDEIDASLRALEAEATLDVLTDGWFTALRAGSGRPPP